MSYENVLKKAYANTKSFEELTVIDNVVGTIINELITSYCREKDYLLENLSKETNVINYLITKATIEEIQIHINDLQERLKYINKYIYCNNQERLFEKARRIK